MKLIKEDKEGIQKVVNGELPKWELLHLYALRNLEEYLEQIGIYYADDSVYKQIYTITYYQKDTDDLFMLNGNDKIQIFEINV